jgi:hypothetical protein
MPFPKIEDWKAPWEKPGADGSMPEFDAEMARTHIYNLSRAEHTLKEEKSGLSNELQTVKSERDTLQSEKDAKAREGETEQQRLQRELEDARRKLADAGKDSIETIRLRVALKKGLTEKQAARLVGSTEEELLADADDYLAENGPRGDDPPKGDDDKPKGDVRRRPVSNALDPEGGTQGSDPLSDEKVLEMIPRA